MDVIYTRNVTDNATGDAWRLEILATIGSARTFRLQVTNERLGFTMRSEWYADAAIPQQALESLWSYLVTGDARQEAPL